MTDQDRKKSCLSIVFFVLSFILPGVSLIVSWIGWNWKVGVIAGLVTFAIFFVLGSIFAIWIKTPSWFTVLLPAIAGLLYVVLPDFIPLPFDDTLVAAAGAITSFALAVNRYTDMPRWILFPLLGSAVYTVVGSVIPGPVDELFVGIISMGLIANEIRKRQLASMAQGLLPKSESPASRNPES